MIIRFKSNLDLDPTEKWPVRLPYIPRVGDYVESAREWPGKKRLSLQVQGVTWTFEDDGDNEFWVPCVHLGWHGSIYDFQNIYRRLRAPWEDDHRI